MAVYKSEHRLIITAAYAAVEKVALAVSLAFYCRSAVKFPAFGIERRKKTGDNPGR